MGAGCDAHLMKVEAVNPSVFLDIKIGARDVGRVVIELYEQQAPLTSSWFQSRITQHVFDGVKFGRAIKNFMVQTAVEEGQKAEVPALEKSVLSMMLQATFSSPLFHNRIFKVNRRFLVK